MESTTRDFAARTLTATVTSLSPFLIAQLVETAPDAPSGLAGNAFSTTQIDLTWADNAINETGFKIERCIPKGRRCNFVGVGTAPANATGFADNNGLVKSTLYSYRIRAYNDAGDSNYSGVITVKTLRR